ncbi:MAG: RNA polymerase sigma factor [Lentisphaerae bacterium]|nr:RNA polymerase sigma factor [Lentisphaerota bacterium]
MELHARIIFRKRRRHQRDVQVVCDFEHCLGEWLCVVHNHAHRAHDVRCTNRLVARERREEKRIVRIEEKNVAHQVVRDHRTDGARARTVSGHQLAVENLNNICYRHSEFLLVVCHDYTIYLQPLFRNFKQFSENAFISFSVSETVCLWYTFPPMTVKEHYVELAPKLVNWLVATGSTYAQSCDIVQNTFLKIWKMRDALIDDDASVSGLAFTIARNLRKNEVRDSRHLVFTDSIPEDAGTVNAPATTPSDTKYLRERLVAAFARLPPLLREAYTLFQIAEMSISEISRTTNATESLVKVRIHRAKGKLREMLADLKV